MFDFICNTGKPKKTPSPNLLIINQDDNFQKCGFSKDDIFRIYDLYSVGIEKPPGTTASSSRTAHILLYIHHKDNKIPEYPETPEMPRISIISTPGIQTLILHTKIPNSG